MKIFKVYAKTNEYIVLKCPYCKRIFRTTSQEKAFGNYRENSKCQKCEKMFNIKENSLDYDPTFKHWNSDDIIMIDPDGKGIKTKKDKVLEDIEFKSADKL